MCAYSHSRSKDWSNAASPASTVLTRRRISSGSTTCSDVAGSRAQSPPRPRNFSHIQGRGQGRSSSPTGHSRPARTSPPCFPRSRVDWPLPPPSPNATVCPFWTTCAAGGPRVSMLTAGPSTTCGLNSTIMSLPVCGRTTSACATILLPTRSLSSGSPVPLTVPQLRLARC